MFNDSFLLTESVLRGVKTMTRRIITPKPITLRHWNPKYNAKHCYYDDFQLISENNRIIKPGYEAGEFVAIAEAYRDVWKTPLAEVPEELQAGWSNKMFVKAEYMSSKIQIINVWAERLQDISDADCQKEGIEVQRCHIDKELEYGIWNGNKPLILKMTARDAYAELIDKVNGKGTWKSNPLVWVYDFKLSK